MYELAIYFFEKDVQEIDRRGLKVALSREVEGGGGEPLVWLTFRPFEANTVRWGRRFGVYGSTTSVLRESSTDFVVTVQKTSEKNLVEAGMIYPFVDGTFQETRSRETRPREAGSRETRSGPAGDDEYGISNLEESALSFGLTQSADLNGEILEYLPLNTCAVEDRRTVTFHVTRRVSLFLHQGSGSEILPENPEGLLTVELTEERSREIVHYDPRKKRFVLGMLPGL